MAERRPRRTVHFLDEEKGWALCGALPDAEGSWVRKLRQVTCLLCLARCPPDLLDTAALFGRRFRSR